MSDEERIDQIYQEAFNSVKETAEEEFGIETVSPHPSVRTFVSEHGSVTVELGNGLIFYLGEQSVSNKEVTAEEFKEEVPDEEADFLIACAEMWSAIGKQQRQKLSTEYLERYM